jgi:hypothetical protein
MDSPDMGYCEFQEFLCRLALASNFKILGDCSDALRIQKLCNVRFCGSVSAAASRQ